MKFLKSSYNFSKKVRLDKLCSQDELRPVMGFIYFDEGNAVASDGHVLVSVPISLISNLTKEDIEKLNGKLIRHSVFAQLIKMDKIISITDVDIVACNDTENTIKVSFPIKTEGEEYGYPNYKVIFDNSEKEQAEEISFNSKLLYRLCDSLGQDKPIIKPNGNHAIKVRFGEPYEEIKAIIMPLLID